jgi:hypothetical protein
MRIVDTFQDEYTIQNRTSQQKISRFLLYIKAFYPDISIVGPLYEPLSKSKPFDSFSYFVSSVDGITEA